jgi:hypothetical protein
MPTKVRDGQSSFAGGLRTKGEITQDGEAEVLENFRIRPSGSIEVRAGSQFIHSSAFAGRIQGIFHWRRNSGSDYLAVIANAELHTASSFINYPVTFTNQGAAVAFGSTPVNFAGFQNGGTEYLYWTDGGQINKWDGTTLTQDVTGSPAVSQVIVYNRRLFGFSGATLYWSALDEGDTLGISASGGGQAVIKTFGGGGIRAMAVVGRTLFLFHSDGVSRFTGWTQDDIDISSGLAAANERIGVENVYNVTTYAGYVYWVSQDRNVYRMSEAGDIQQVSSALSFTSAILSVGVANSKDGEIWFAATELGTGEPLVYVYNVPLNAWSTFRLEGGSSVGPTAAFSSDRTVYFGDLAGFVSHMDYTTSPRDRVTAAGSGGTLFDATLQTRPLPFGDASIVKSLRFLQILSDTTGTIDPSLVGETGTETALTGVTGNGAVARVQAWGRYHQPRVKLVLNNDGFASVSGVALDGFAYNRPR